MSSLSDLKTYASDISAAVKTLVSQCQNPPSSSTQPLLTPDASNEAHHARQSILVTISRLQRLLGNPTEFLHHLAVQNKLLACLQWLGEFQILACIPLSGSVPIKDVADLAGVPESHVSRVIRMTATAGFLQEPQPGQVAHSALSALFVLPRRCHVSCRHRCPSRSADAHCNAAVGARSIDRATILTNLYPTIHITVQIATPAAGSNSWSSPIPSKTPCSKHDGPRQLTNTSSSPSSIGTSTPPNVNITIQQRTPTAPQTITDASVYILHLPSSSPTVPLGSLTTRVIAELRAHLDILRSNPSATLILTPRLLPDPAVVNAEVEAAARLRDLTLLQLVNEREIDLAELMNMLNSVSDSTGRLVVVNKIRSGESVVVLLEVRY